MGGTPRALFPLTVPRTSVSTLLPQEIPPPSTFGPTMVLLTTLSWIVLSVTTSGPPSLKIPPPDDDPKLGGGPGEPEAVLPSTVLAVSCSDPLL
jgi:hypothetical protein